MSVTLNPPVAAVGVTAQFAISWTEGTDLQFDIDFGDGNTLQWHWQVTLFFYYFTLLILEKALNWLMCILLRIVISLSSIK